MVKFIQSLDCGSLSIERESAEMDGRGPLDERAALAVVEALPWGPSQRNRPNTVGKTNPSEIAVEGRRESMAPPRQIVVQCRRRQDEQVGHAPTLKDVAKDDQPAERMTVQHHRRAGRPRPNPGKLGFLIVEDVAPRVHVRL